MSKGAKAVSYYLTLSPEMKSQLDYFLLPFSVDEGVEKILIRYDYDKGLEDDPNVIDLGLFGPGETGFLSASSFRGWSGSNKKEVFVSSSDATPSYYPGRIEAGDWHVLLGLYRISRAGCACEVGLAMDRRSRAHGHEGPLGEGGVNHASESYEEPRWLKGDLHVHSHHSDGSLPVNLIAAEALRRGLDFVAITDHNTTSQAKEVRSYHDPRLCVMLGEEITTYRGHANVWNTDEWLDFRVRSENDAMALINEAHRRRLLFSINHPYLDEWEFKAVRGFDCLEVWCGLWPRMNFKSVEWWDQLAGEGNRIIGVGGSDLHHLEEPQAREVFSVGTPTTWVLSKAGHPDAIVDGIRSGAVFISRKPDGPRLLMRSRTDREMSWMGSRVSLGPTERISIHLDAIGARDMGLRLMSGFGCVACFEIDSSNFSCNVGVSAEERGFFRAEIVEKDGDWRSAPLSEVEVVSVTNHLLVERTRDESLAPLSHP